MEDTAIVVKSWMQKTVALSTTWGKSITIVGCVQEMLYIMKWFNSLQSKVRKPMIVYTDNKGAENLINWWSIGSGTENIDCRIMCS